MESILISLVLGRIIVVFYKKDFSFRVHFCQILCESFSLGSSFLVINLLGSEVSMLFLVFNCKFFDQKLKTAVMAASVWLGFWCSVSKIQLDLLCTVVALTQFIRQPLPLKIKLARIRIMVGPVYPILMLAKLNHSSCVISSLACTIPLIAGVFFRPDNNETLKVFLGKTVSSKVRRNIHGGLMAFSMLYSLLELDTCLLLLGVFNLVLYSIYKINILS